MNPRIYKEIRTLLPMFALATLAPLVTFPLLMVWSRPAVLSLNLLLAGFGSIAAGAMVFGDELGNRTMGLLLSQPLSRVKIWRGKMLVLGIAVITGFVIVSFWVYLFEGQRLQNDSENFIIGLLMILGYTIGIFCTLPFWTLQVKSAVGAGVFALIAPMAIIIAMNDLVDRFPVLKRIGGDEEQTYLMVLSLGLYFGFCYWLGRRTFLRFQVIEGQGQEVRLPDGLERVLGWPWRKLMSGSSGVWKSLIDKEVHLQRTSLMLALIFCVIFFLEAAGWKCSKSETTIIAFLWLMVGTVIVYCILIPLLTGGVCIAEERNWGMIGWQLALPPSKLRQWLVKVGTAFASCIVLGVILPVVVFELCKAIFHFPISPFDDPDSPLGNGPDRLGIVNLTLIYLTLPSVAVFASSLSSGALRATVLALVLNVLLMCSIPLIGNMATRFAAYLFHPGVMFSDWSLIRLMLGLLIIAILAIPLFLCLVNYKKVELSAQQRWVQLFFCGAAIYSCIFLFFFMVEMMRF